MRRGVAVVLMGCTLLLTAGVARAVDGHDLSEEELQAEIAQNRALRAYVDRNGLPDVADTHFLADRPPWDEYEVRLYYLERRFEIAFARAFVLGRPEVQIEHYERPLTDQQVSALQSRARMHSTAHADTTSMRDSLSPADRAEAAARRAEAAAGRVEAAVAIVERAATRAEAVVKKMETASAAPVKTRR
jgi:hypothetical protein